LRHVTIEDNKYTMLSYFNKADPDLGARQIRVLNADGSKVKTMSEKLSDE
jgi:catalase